MPHYVRIGNDDAYEAIVTHDDSVTHEVYVKAAIQGHDAPYEAIGTYGYGVAIVSPVMAVY